MGTLLTMGAVVGISRGGGGGREGDGVVEELEEVVCGQTLVQAI